MADSLLQIQRPYGVPLPGRFGRQDGDPGVRVEMHGALSICTIQPFHGRRAACATALKDAIEFDLPSAGRSIRKGRDMLVWSGLDMFVAIFADLALVERIRTALGGNAAIVDQSDGKVLFRVSGCDARALLEKGVTVDLHPQAFAAGHVSLTLLSHLSAQIIQCDETPTYEIVVSRVFAADFWHWLEESASEFGLTLSEYGNGG